MNKHLLLSIFLLSASASTSHAASKKSTDGWQELPNTTLKSVCPPNGFGGVDYDFNFFCQSVTITWGGAALDSKRNRLYLWGGGHTDYSGNEIYALDLNSKKMLRLTAPALPLAQNMEHPHPSELAPFDGTQPNSRHTYDGMEYLPKADRLWSFGGSLAASGGTDNVTWIFDPNSKRWQRDHSRGSLPTGDYGIVSAYNPNTDSIILHDQRNLYSYKYAVGGGIYTKLAEDKDFGIHLTGAFDPQRNLFLMVGAGHEYSYDLSPGKIPVRTTIRSTGDREIVDSEAPGLAYDPRSKLFVAWAGGNNIYTFNPQTNIWRKISIPNGPGPAACNGTYGRWAYSPISQAFVTYNWYEDNAFMLSLPALHLNAKNKFATQAPVSPAASTQKKPISQQALAKNSETITQPAVSSNPNVINSDVINPGTINPGANSPAAMLKKSVSAAGNTAQKLRLPGLADTYISRYTDKVGQQAYLQVSKNTKALIKFDGSLISNLNTVSQASLRLYQQSKDSTATMYLGVFQSPQDWDEDSNWQYSHYAKDQTWNNRLGDWTDMMGVKQGGQPFDLQEVAGSPKGNWVEWDITALVNQVLQNKDAGTNPSLWIRSLSGNNDVLRFYSQDHQNTELRPQLWIEQ